jgi:hypothetical protein
MEKEEKKEETRMSRKERLLPDALGLRLINIRGSQMKTGHHA